MPFLPPNQQRQSTEGNKWLPTQQWKMLKRGWSFQGLSRTHTRFQDCPRSATTLSRRSTTQKFTLTMTIWWINLLTISSCSLTAIPPMHRPHRSNGNPSASSCLLNCWRISLVCRASSLYKQPNAHACTTEALLINKPKSTGCRFCSLKFSYSMSALWSAIGYHQRLASLQLVRLIIAQISTTLQMQLWEWEVAMPSDLSDRQVRYHLIIYVCGMHDHCQS